MLRYYWMVLREGAAAFSTRVREKRRNVIAFLVQTAGLLGLLYFMPWFGRIQDESRIVAATVAAVIGAAILTFLWELIKAPATIHGREREEKERLLSVLRLDQDAEAIRSAGLTLYERWRAAFPANTPTRVNDTVRELEAWADRFVKENYDQTNYFSYLYGMGYKSQNPGKRNAAFYEKRLDQFHTLLLSYRLTIEHNAERLGFERNGTNTNSG